MTDHHTRGQRMLYDQSCVNILTETALSEFLLVFKQRTLPNALLPSLCACTV
jgi:hypothetical protein